MRVFVFHKRADSIPAINGVPEKIKGFQRERIPRAKLRKPNQCQAKNKERISQFGLPKTIWRGPKIIFPKKIMVKSKSIAR